MRSGMTRSTTISDPSGLCGLAAVSQEGNAVFVVPIVQDGFQQIRIAVGRD